MSLTESISGHFVEALASAQTTIEELNEQIQNYRTAIQLYESHLAKHGIASPFGSTTPQKLIRDMTREELIARNKLVQLKPQVRNPMSVPFDQTVANELAIEAAVQAGDMFTHIAESLAR